MRTINLKTWKKIKNRKRFLIFLYFSYLYLLVRRNFLKNLFIYFLTLVSIVIFSGLFMQTLFSEFYSHCVPHTFGHVTTKLNLLNKYFLLIVIVSTTCTPVVYWFLNRLAKHSNKNNEIITIVNSK